MDSARIIQKLMDLAFVGELVIRIIGDLSVNYLPFRLINGSDFIEYEADIEYNADIHFITLNVKGIKKAGKRETIENICNNPKPK